MSEPKVLSKEITCYQRFYHFTVRYKRKKYEIVIRENYDTNIGAYDYTEEVLAPEDYDEETVEEIVDYLISYCMG